MVNNQYEGWYAYMGYGQNKGLEKSWKTVVWGCLNNRKDKGREGSQDIEEKLKRLNTTIWNFTRIPSHANGRHKRGGYNDHHTASDGSDEKRIHVHYDTCDQLKKPWWKKLKEALKGKTETQLLVNRSAVTNTQDPLTPPPEEKGNTMLTAAEEGVPIPPPSPEDPTGGPTTEEEGGNGTVHMTQSDGLRNNSTNSTEHHRIRHPGQGGKLQCTFPVSQDQLPHNPTTLAFHCFFPNLEHTRNEIKPPHK
ncbi:unnamed protein product [Trypanosoma congolense IL3000]|uniref:WGS project CAEQ00000000 data, annotated contig 1070 n=1 Tax=Trypanosoma congolense (strain IL3000) TaxID=1068625 RepID=F9W3L1_TRYCI|nr:unnamed protein product [Trypanosoma congolense IL3000]